MMLADLPRFEIDKKGKNGNDKFTSEKELVEFMMKSKKRK